MLKKDRSVVVGIRSGALCVRFLIGVISPILVYSLFEVTPIRMLMVVKFLVIATIMVGIIYFNAKLERLVMQAACVRIGVWWIVSNVIAGMLGLVIGGLTIHERLR